MDALKKSKWWFEYNITGKNFGEYEYSKKDMELYFKQQTTFIIRHLIVSEITGSFKDIETLITNWFDCE
jgi:polyisoprenoid-binding protein YceI